MLRAGNLLSAGVLNIFCTMMAIKKYRWSRRSLALVPPFSGFCMLTGCENHRPKQHTHTCSEISYRIVDVECIGRAKNTPVKLNRRNEIYIYIYKWDYGGLHGSRGGVFVGHRPPRDPGDALQKIEVLYLFRWYTHTHAPPQRGT